MSSIPVQLLRVKDGSLTDASLHLELHPNKLIEVETKWGPIRRQAVRRLQKNGYPVEKLPRHFHWDWGAKSQHLKLIAYRCFGVECEGDVQGLMMMDLASKFARLAPDKDKPLVYVDYLESAPWNVQPLTDTPIFSGVGLVLIRAAVQLSLEEGFQGRVALHSLKQAEKFYREKCGMQSCGKDEDYHGLEYFELTREQAKIFIK